MRHVAVLAAAFMGVSLGGGALAQAEEDAAAKISAKLQPYIACINRLSDRAHSSEARYKSWVKGSGPTGGEKIIYGTYTIYDTSGCRKGVEAANKAPPSNPKLEKAGADFSSAVGALEPLLKEADDYYTQANYKDDKMAKGKELHPRLLVAWAAFNAADASLRDVVEDINDEVQVEALAAIEKSEGRKANYFVRNLMIKAKTLARAEGGDPKAMDLPKVIETLGAFEEAMKSLEQYSTDHADDKVGSFFLSTAKSFLASAKGLMRRVRDKVPYSSGERMMIDNGAGQMIDGTPQHLTRSYNELVDRFNGGPRI